MRPISTKFKMELSKLTQDALLELWTIDLRAIKDNSGEYGDVYRFHNGLNGVNADVVFASEIYTAYPIIASGFESSSQGPSNRPTLSIANLNGLVTAISERYAQAVGARVKRVLVSAKYIDAINFASGKNPYADPSEGALSHYYIERLSQLDNDVGTFELASPAETDKARIPLRMITADVCAFKYRSPECGYTGGAVADEFDKPTNDPKKDRCSHCLTGCRFRFKNGILPFGGFPSVNTF